MTITEKKINLFTLDSTEYTFAHCISADCKMSAGIAVPMKEKFRLHTMWDVYKRASSLDSFKVGRCIVYNKVCNLITKERYFHKPTYDSLTATLIEMKEYVVDNKISKIAMPKIGCGLDKLQWGEVKSILEDIFKDTNVEITVCDIKGEIK